MYIFIYAYIYMCVYIYANVFLLRAIPSFYNSMYFSIPSFINATTVQSVLKVIYSIFLLETYLIKCWRLNVAQTRKM